MVMLCGYVEYMAKDALTLKECQDILSTMYGAFLIIERGYWHCSWLQV